MAFVYTRSQLMARINAGIHGKQGMLIDADEVCNEAVRQVTSDIDLRSARRRGTLSPNLYNGIFDYVCPTDLDASKIIDIPAQAKRQDGEFFLVPTNEFEQKKRPGMIAIKNIDNGTRALQISSQVDSKSITISELDSLTSALSSGSWALFGDAETLAADTDDFVKGNGSIKFNLSAAGGTTAGIQATTVNSVDITDYLGGTSSIFVWAKINSTTNLTNYILRLGNDSSNYYAKTVTAQADGTAFVAGWNLLKFDLSSLAETGSVDDTAIDYFVIYMTKTAGKISESDYKFDWLVLKRGVIHNIEYYTGYGWTDSSGTYLANSTSDSDLLVAAKDEYGLIIQKGIEIAAKEVKEYDVAATAKLDYKDMKAQYILRNPSEAKIYTSGYYEY